MAYRQAASLRPEIPEIYADLGILEHDTGKYDEAAKDLQTAARLKPSLYSAQLFLGLSYLHLDRPKDAVSPLLLAVRLNASDTHAQFALGRAYTSLREWQKAATVYRNVLTGAPRNSSAWFALGISYLQQVENDSRTLSNIQSPASYRKVLFADSLAEQRRYVEAANLYREAEQESPTLPCIRSAEGLALLRQGKKVEARNELEQARTQEPGCNLALLGLAAIDIQESKTDEGIEKLEESWKRDKGFTLSSLPEWMTLLSPEQLERAKSALASRQDDHADLEAGALADAINRAGNSTGMELAKYPAVGKPADSSPAVPFDLRKAQQEFSEGEYATCVTQLQSGAAHVSSAALRLRSACAFLTGAYAVASQSAALLRGSSAGGPEGLYWSIKSNEKLALAALDQFADLAPQSARTHLLLGDIDRQRQHYENAVDEYTRALHIEPNNYAALQGLASAYLLDGKLADAETTAEKALSQRPDEPELNILMGEALVAERKYEASEPYLKKALMGNPQLTIHAHALLGRAYASTGRSQEAFTELKLGLSSDDDGSLHYLIGRLYSNQGDKASATLAFKQAKELSTDRAHRAVIAMQDSASLEDSLSH